MTFSKTWQGEEENKKEKGIVEGDRETEEKEYVI
jgi:hypothetical protein